MKSQLDPKDLASATLENEQTTTKPQSNVFFVAETYSIQRRPKAELAVANQTSKYEAIWLPKRVVQVTERSGVSSATLFGGLLTAALGIYLTITLTTIDLWNWLAVHSLTGVASLAMIFGAQAIIGILFAVIEENDSVHLVSRFTQFVGAQFLYAGSFLLGGWLSTQGLLALFTPSLGRPTALFLSVVALCLTTQFILSNLIRLYRATNR